VRPGFTGGTPPGGRLRMQPNGLPAGRVSRAQHRGGERVPRIDAETRATWRIRGTAAARGTTGGASPLGVAGVGTRDRRDNSIAARRGLRASARGCARRAVARQAKRATGEGRRSARTMRTSTGSQWRREAWRRPLPREVDRSRHGPAHDRRRGVATPSAGGEMTQGVLASVPPIATSADPPQPDPPAGQGATLLHRSALVKPANAAAFDHAGAPIPPGLRRLARGQGARSTCVGFCGLEVLLPASASRAGARRATPASTVPDAAAVAARVHVLHDRERPRRAATRSGVLGRRAGRWDAMAIGEGPIKRPVDRSN